MSEANTDRVAVLRRLQQSQQAEKLRLQVEHEAAQQVLVRELELQQTAETKQQKPILCPEQSAVQRLLQSHSESAQDHQHHGAHCAHDHQLHSEHLSPPASQNSNPSATELLEPQWTAATPAVSPAHVDPELAAAAAATASAADLSGPNFSSAHCLRTARRNYQTVADRGFDSNLL